MIDNSNSPRLLPGISNGAEDKRPPVGGWAGVKGWLTPQIPLPMWAPVVWPSSTLPQEKLKQCQPHLIFAVSCAFLSVVSHRIMKICHLLFFRMFLCILWFIILLLLFVKFYLNLNRNMLFFSIASFISQSLSYENSIFVNKFKFWRRIGISWSISRHNSWLKCHWQGIVCIITKIKIIK